MTIFRGALPIDVEDDGRFLLVIAAIMVFLAALSLAGAFVVQNAVARWHADVTGALTIQVLPRPGDPAESARLTREDVERVVAEVRGQRGVLSVEPMSDEELKTLMEPWLGSSEMVADLPLPRLVGVALEDGARIDVPYLEARLRELAPGVLVEDHRTYLSGLVLLARSLLALAWLTVALVTLATSIAVVQATRAGMSVHWPMIEVLHLIGATDGAIAARFERRALKQAFVGAAVGVASSLVVMLVVGHFTSDIEGGVIPVLTLSPANWAIIVCLPVLAAALALAATRWTVMRALARML